MDSKLILVVIGVIATVPGRSEAITCFYCSGDSKCSDPFNFRAVETCEGVVCAKAWTTSSRRWITFLSLNHSHPIPLTPYSTAHLIKPTLLHSCYSWCMNLF